jgi:stress response protein YsnF
LEATKTTAESANHAAKGALNALKGATKDTAEGVSDAAKGVGDALKGAAKDTAEGVNQAVAGALDTVKGVAENAQQSVIGASDAVKDKAEDAKQSVVGALDTVKDKAEDIKPSDNQTDNQSLKIAKERVIIDNSSSVYTGEVGIGEPVGTQIDVISDPAEIDRIVDQTQDVNPETSLALAEADFREGRGIGSESFEK